MQYLTLFSNVFRYVSKLHQRLLPGSKISPKYPPNASKILARASQDPSKRLQESPRCAQQRPRSPKCIPEVTQEAPRSLQEDLRKLQEAPRSPPEVPDSPVRAPRGSQMPPRRPPKHPFSASPAPSSWRALSLSKHLGQRASPTI